MMWRLLAALMAAPVALAAQDSAFEVLEIDHGLYRYTFGAHHSLAVLTHGGMVVIDPISTEAAAAMAGDLPRRLPGVTLRAIVYSHHHADHATGADALRRGLDAPDAPVIGHVNAAAAIAADPRPGLPAPDSTFSDSLILTDPDRPVVLYYVGPSHSDNMVVTYLPRERLAFAVDFVGHDRVGYRDLGSFEFPGQFTAIERLLRVPFDTIYFGHGPPGNRASVERQLRYYRSLELAVTEAISRGWSEDEAAERIRLVSYAEWGGYESWFPLNVRGMYRSLRARGR